MGYFELCAGLQKILLSARKDSCCACPTLRVNEVPCRKVSSKPWNRYSLFSTASMLGTIAAAEGGNEAKNWIWNLELLYNQLFWRTKQECLDNFCRLQPDLKHAIELRDEEQYLDNALIGCAATSEKLLQEAAHDR